LSSWKWVRKRAARGGRVGGMVVERVGMSNETLQRLLVFSASFVVHGV
jgi:hypothetical protein